MQTPELSLPEPTPTDPEVVATALETANIFGVQGDVKEALRWIRRAAELAGDAGDDDRALNLARAAADLTTHVEQIQRASAPELNPERPVNAEQLSNSHGAPPPPP